MNVQQKLIVTFVTVAILVAIAVALQYIDKENLNKDMIKYFLSAVILLALFFFVFIADICSPSWLFSNGIDFFLYYEIICF